MDTIHTIGIDLAKSVFQLCAFNRAGKKLFNKMLRRNQLLRFLSNIGPCLIGMEACRSQNESTFYSLANEFYEAAYQLGLIKVVNIKFYAVQLYLYGHASELFAKSILYSLGCNVKNIKNSDITLRN